MLFKFSRATKQKEKKKKKEDDFLPFGLHTLNTFASHSNSGEKSQSIIQRRRESMPHF